MNGKILIFAWGFLGILLFLYSFTQVDLSLTLSKESLVRTMQTSFQYVGWYLRDLSTYLYIGLITLMTFLFVITVSRVAVYKVTQKTITLSILVIAIILTLSYSAFSYDIFNYIFDAKIITHYQLNPYLNKALDFPNDPMLSFMRSTHRVYPYGPSWLLVTVPFSYIGMNIFIVTFFLFKALSTFSYIATCYLLYVTAKKLGIKNPLLAVSLFAFNPLVLIEGLVSAHNEIVMMAIVMLAFYLLISKQKTRSLIAFVFSIGIKYTTVFLAPIFIASIFTKKYLEKERLLPISLFLMTLAVIATSVASGQNKNPEFQPWYLLSLAPFVSLYENRLARSTYIAISITALMSYVPFLWSGEWPIDIVMIKNTLIVVGLAIGVIFGLLVRRIAKK